MKRLISGMVPLLALLLAAGCTTEPTASLRNGVAKLIAAPSQLFIDLGSSKSVDVSAMDEQGNPLQFDYQVTAVGPGITVKRDSTYLPIYVDDTTLTAPPIGPTFRFTVTGTGYAATSFTVAAGDSSVVIPVQVVPQNQIAATFDNPTPALGDTITLTAPAGNTFTQTAELCTTPACVDDPSVDSLNPVIVARDPAGTFIKFLAPPNLNAPITITEVLSASAPGVTFIPATFDRLITPVIDTVDVTFSTATPTLGQPVTATSNNPLIRFRPDVAQGPNLAGINFPGLLNGPLRGPDTLHLHSGAGPQNVTVAADSSSMTFDAPPNANGLANVVSFVFPGQFSLALPTRTGITAPNIGTVLNAPFNPASPGLFDSLTITAPAGFFFGPIETDSVIIGGQVAINQSLGAGGSSITVVPLPGSKGVATISGVSPSAAPQFALKMPTAASVDIPQLNPIPGTGSVSTAPTIPAPGTLVDFGSFAATDCGPVTGGFPCQVYKFTLAAGATMNFNLEGIAPALADLGLYFLLADGVTDAPQACDAQGRASPPENCNLTFAAGTYYMEIITFGPGYPQNDPPPRFVRVTIQ